MRSANLLNDFAFKYVFGEDCKEANDALKSLLTVFLERKVNYVVVKNLPIRFSYYLARLHDSQELEENNRRF